MANYKEIVTKAVVGKAKKSSSNKFSLTPEFCNNPRFKSLTTPYSIGLFLCQVFIIFVLCNYM